MRIGTLALAASAMVLAGTASGARGGQASPAPDAAAASIAARQAGMRMSAALVASMKGAIDRGDDVKQQAAAAGAIVAWAKAIPGMFPEGSFVPPTNALSTVWSDPVGFKGKAENYQIAATLLANAAAAGDKEGFASAWGQVRATCGACHNGYKKP